MLIHPLESPFKENEVVEKERVVSNDRKLEAVIVTLTMLLPRLTNPYRGDVEECIKLSEQVREDIKEKDDGNDEEGLHPSS